MAKKSTSKKSAAKKKAAAKTRAGASGAKRAASTKSGSGTQKPAPRAAAAKGKKAPAGSAKAQKPAKKAAPQAAGDVAAKSSSGASGVSRNGKKKSSAATKDARGAKTTERKPASAKRSRKTAKSDQSKNGGHSVAAAASTATANSSGYVFINGRRVRTISTKGLNLSKKSRLSANAETAAAEDNGPVKVIKTKLSKRELQHYRDLLLIKRAELVGVLSAMEAEALRSSGGDLSHMPIHMADIGTDVYDQDFKLGMAQAERKLVGEIDQALHRIEDKTYGVCQMTGNPIPKARLDAKPWAKYTIEAARLVESGRYLG